MRKALLILLALVLVASVFVSCNNDPKTVTVTFNPGDAPGDPYTQNVPIGVATKLTANSFTYDGHGFVCWSMSPSGGDDFSDQQTVTLTENLKLYAMWGDLYKITVEESEKGEVIPAEDSYIVSDKRQTVLLQVTPDKDYYLSGISLENSDNEEAYSRFFIIYIPKNSTGDIVITPIFEEKPDEVNFVNAKWEDSQVKTNSDTKNKADYSLVHTYSNNWDETVEDWYFVANDVELTERINVSGNINLILRDGVTLKADKGINVPKGSSLIIYGQSKGTGKLTINGVDSGFAGIGGSPKDDCGTIEIKGGDIQVTGGENGAGIGAGDNHKAGTVSILKGTITATGGDNGAGIGGGNASQNGGTINIYGGTVATQGGKHGAGIGGGAIGEGGTILIAGGSVTARGYMSYGMGGAGIGGGSESAGGTITISGAATKVEAYGGDFSAGIGGGDRGDGGTVKIRGGALIKAEGNRGAAGIGGAFGGNGANVTISGGNLEIKGGEGEVDMGVSPHICAIGKGYFHSSEEGKHNDLILEDGFKLEAQNYSPGSGWEDWHEGDARLFRMRTKPAT